MGRKPMRNQRRLATVSKNGIDHGSMVIFFYHVLFILVRPWITLGFMVVPVDKDSFINMHM